MDNYNDYARLAMVKAWVDYKPGQEDELALAASKMASEYRRFKRQMSILGEDKSDETSIHRVHSNLTNAHARVTPVTPFLVGDTLFYMLTVVDIHCFFTDKSGYVTTISVVKAVCEEGKPLTEMEELYFVTRGMAMVATRDSSIDAAFGVNKGPISFNPEFRKAWNGLSFKF